MCTKSVHFGIDSVSICRWMQKIKQLTNGSLCDSLFSVQYATSGALSLVSGISPVAHWCCIDKAIFKVHLYRAHWVFIHANVHHASSRLLPPLHNIMPIALVRIVFRVVVRID
jgi:hypothetical protein